MRTICALTRLPSREDEIIHDEEWLSQRFLNECLC